jgi:hypothetical protein
MKNKHTGAFLGWTDRQPASVIGGESIEVIQTYKANDLLDNAPRVLKMLELLSESVQLGHDVTELLIEVDRIIKKSKGNNSL